MMNTRHLVWIPVLVLSSYVIRPCYALQIDISPDTYTEENHGPVNVTCSLDSTDNKLDIFALKINRNGGNPIVFVRRSGGGFGDEYKYSPKFQAAGKISTDVASSYLRLSIFDPDETDGGIYECNMFFADSKRKIVKNFTVNIINLSDVVRELMSTVSSLKHKMEVQTAKHGVEINDLKKSDWIHGSEISHLRVKTTVLENITQIQRDKTEQLENITQIQRDKTEQLESVTMVQGIEISELSDIVSYTSAFSACLSANRLTETFKTVVFDKLIMRQGDGYDVSTGVFTVPRDGIYAFHVAMMCWPLSAKKHDRKGNVKLKVDDKDVAQLLANVPEDVLFLQSSVSTVASLTRGQKVSVEAFASVQWYGGVYSTFNGFLIRAT